MNRRAIIILGAIFFLIVGTLVFVIVLRSGGDTPTEVADTTTEQPEQNETPVPEEENEEPIEEEPTEEQEPDDSFVSEQKVHKLTDDAVISPVLFYQGNGITYFNKQGQLFQNDLQDSNGTWVLTNKKELTLPVKTGISRILWPQTGNNFIAEFQNGTERLWSVYESSKAAYTDLPPQITSLNWVSDGEVIIYIWKDSEGKSTMNVADASNTEWETMAEIWEPDDELHISPDDSTILFYRRNSTEAKNPINLTTPDGSLFRSVIKDGYNKGVLWAPDSKQFLFGRRTSSGQEYEIWWAEVNSGATENLEVNSLVEKAVWDKRGQNVYIAVPISGVAGRGLTEDKIVKINAQTLEKTEYELGEGVDARDLFLNLDENILFFKNYQDEALYYLDMRSSGS